MTDWVSFEAAYEILPSDGWLTRPEAELLWEYVGHTQGSILEVGCYKGRSTCLLAATGRFIYAVDPFDGFTTDLPGDAIATILMDNLERRGFGNVVLYRQKVEDWTPLPVGFAYLDGDHTYKGTLAQIHKALFCTPKIIAVHDVNDRGGGAEVKRACLELLGPWKARMERLAVWEQPWHKGG